MPRIKKPKYRLPSEVLYQITMRKDILLDIVELEGFKIGDTVRYDYNVGTVVGFTQNENYGETWCIVEMQCSDGRYDNGYFVYTPSSLIKLS